MAIAPVQQSSVQGPPTSSSFSMPGNFTAGNTGFFVCTYWETAISGVTIGGDTATLDKQIDRGDGTKQEIWRVSNLTGGSATVAISGATTYMRARALEFSGLETSSPIDQDPTTATGTGTAPTVATGTLDQADELAISIAGATLFSGLDSEWTIPSGWTEILRRADWNADSSGAGAYLITSATTALNVVWGMGGSSTWHAAVVTYKAAAGGGVTATVSGSLAGLDVAATVVESIPGTASGELAGLTAALAMNAGSAVSSTVAGELAGLVGAIAVTESIPGTLAAILPGLEGAIVLAEGNIPGAFLEAALVMAVSYPCAIAGVLAGLTCEASVEEVFTGTLAGSMAWLDADLVMDHSTGEEITSTIAAVLAGLTGAFTANESLPVTMAGEFAGLACAASVTETLLSSMAAALPGLAAALELTHDIPAVNATVAGSLAGLTAAIEVLEAFPPFTVAGVQPGLDAALTASSAAPVAGTLAASLPGLTAQLDVSTTVEDTGDGGGGGRRRSRSRYKPTTPM